MAKQTNPVDRLQQQILALFPNPEAHFQYGFQDLADLLGVQSREDKIDLSYALQRLLKDKALQELSNGKFRLPAEEKPTEARIELVNPRFAYAVLEGDAADVYIDGENLRGAQDGDRVHIEIFNSRKGKKTEGLVLKVVERARNTYVGTLRIRGGNGWLTADYKRMHDEVMVHEEHLNGAKNGQKVMVEIRNWGGPNRRPIGEVKEVLGEPGEHNAEMHAILADFNIPIRFSEDVEAEAEAIPKTISKEEIGKRRDFRETTTFTIDPFDAKDFDDALSIRPLEDNLWEVGIHIADVSHYLQPGTLLDQAAIDRATSVYLVDRVSPMLPEVLSNNLCSLRPKEDRLTFSCVVHIDKDGMLHGNPWIGRTVIHSNRRFTYEEVQEILEGKEGEFQADLFLLNQMHHAMRNRRMRSGAMSFESTEVKFVLDANGVPLKVIPKVRKDAHKLIEEFMLLANRCVAEFAYNYDKGKEMNPMVYRVHEAPNPERLKTFADFAARFGHKINTDLGKVAGSLNEMISDLEGRPEQELIQNLAIRVMAKARYTVKPLGHFGLAFRHYSHFTSPIRRYPDVLTHRLLWEYLRNQPRPTLDALEKQCVHCSDKEKKAAEAERASIKYKQVEFMTMQDATRVFDGVVSGVTEFGVFIEIIENRCEGLVRMTDLEMDHFDYLEDEYCLVGRKTGVRITFGDKVQVRLKSANLEKRTIDFYLEGDQWQNRSAKRPQFGKTSDRNRQAKTDREKKSTGGARKSGKSRRGR